MQIFLDSANIQEIEEINSLNIIDGLTTNPSLIAKSTGNFNQIIQDICKIIQGDVSVEIIAEDYQQMIVEGKALKALAKNIVLKLPLTWPGIMACKYFSKQGIKVNLTLCFSANQALLAAKAGASYVSLFIGRLDDIGHEGIELLQSVRTIFDNYPELHTKILAASIRHPNHFYQSALIGADIITMSGKHIKELIKHPLTDKGLEIFNHDWQNRSVT